VNRWILALLTLVGTATAAVKYPFPYVAPYPYGSYTGRTSDANRALSALKSWLTNYYTDCPDGTARVKWVDPIKGDVSGSKTVSEGIGYGMLITVYLDNDSIGNKARFDKLWGFYKRNRNGKGLMNWQIQGCSEGTPGANGATDAELDVALALAMAYKQWGTEQYKTDAVELIGKIWNAEVNQGEKLLKSGDEGNLPYNPSYFSLGALRVFKQLDPNHDWEGVANASLALLKKAQHSTTGLVPDWCNNQGQSQDANGSGTNKFGYDAARTPWRVLTDYLWFGTADAKSFLSKIDTWIKNETESDPNYILREYSTDGKVSVEWPNALYVGALVVPGMIASNPDDWLTTGADMVFNFGNDNYYNDSWKVIYLITLSGGLQNYWGTVKPNTVGVIDADGRRIPMNWSVSTTASKVVVTLPGEGAASLVDASGKVHASASGKSRIELVRPADKGVLFAVVRAGGEQVAIPVVGD